MSPASRFRSALLIGAVLLLCALHLPAQVPSPHAIDIPAWFTEGFLDFKEETAALAQSGKRLMVYFGQDGCPYCRELMQTNFSQKPIVEKARRHFDAIAINIWGDREVTWIDGRTMSEKDFARFLRVQFTPTVLFFDAGGNVVVRLNGYYPPSRFSAALEYVAGRMEGREPLGAYLERAVRETANAKLNEQPFFLRPPYHLARVPGSKPLAVIFETRFCKPCDEMHQEGFERAEVRAQLQRFDVARFSLSDSRELITPAGRKQSAQAWARELKISYTPAVVFFDDTNREVFRIDGYLRPFHLATSFEYVSGGEYLREPEFQRFIQAKADRMRSKGRRVDLWR